MEQELVLEIPSDVRSIHHAVEYVVARCRDCEARAERLRLNLRVGLTEALSNAMLYGNGRDPAKRVLVEVSFIDGAIRARVTDQGDGFDPLSVPDPTEPENVVKAGGRGLFIMRQLLDEVSFNEQGNAVTLVLRLDPDTGLGGGASA